MGMATPSAFFFIIFNCWGVVIAAQACRGRQIHVG
jgi:hypothetical protein